ncbi:peptidase M20 [Tepiditoga spiralis]|uniref:Peptidase M20 n=1 Tax=Tepiditoga spiralis TaxID=2108365 RepID=A0A7G1G456_9BACT|nr:amidohydrolase [Tepiditoga spiralis]BBE30855.1 peptidase M20 [Tepiditoga spiralis]
MKSPIELRHLLHQNPETSFNEVKTTKLLIESIEDLAKEYNIKLNVLTPLNTGLIVVYNPSFQNSYTLFRADIDALPIKEQTNCDFSSKNDNMHACGHDVHMSILYGFMKYIFENKIQKNFIFLFQPGEEGGGGAKLILDSKVLENFDIKNAYALHVTDEYSIGTIATTKGVLFASAMEIDIEFYGKAAHIAFPQDGLDSFKAARLFFNAVESLPKNPIEPFVFGIGKVKSGNVRNVISDYTKLEGSIRTLSMKKAEKFKNKLIKILNGIKDITNVDFKISIGSFYKEVINDDNMYNKQIDKIKNFKIIDCGYKMTGEDFGFIAEKYPSLMFWLGTGGKKVGLHSPKFLPNDDVIEIGINLFKNLINE